MKRSYLSYPEFMELAMQNYCKGGDEYVECWDESAFTEYVELFGGITKTRATKMFKLTYSIQKDRAAW